MTSGPRFAVKPYLNPRTQTTSWRVEGFDTAGRRVRKNFAIEEDALAQARDLEAACLRVQSARAPRLVQTRLTDAELLATEAAANALPTGRTLEALLEAGARALAHSPAARDLAPLATEWIEVMKREVSPGWQIHLSERVRAFLKLHPGLTTDRFTRPLVRKWIDDMPHAAQTRANYRAAVRRFGSWLVERGHLAENPAAEIRINTARARNEKPPSILTLEQAQGLAWAVTAGPARPLMGWVALCLLCGLRPQMEADKLTWAEVDFKRAIVLVMGKKRGAKTREVPMSAAAVTWLKSVKAAKEPTPGRTHRYWLKVAVRGTNVWLDKHGAKGTQKLKWSGDILRHTYASAQAALGVPLPILAARMGNSPETIHAHYRALMPAKVAKGIMGLGILKQ